MKCPICKKEIIGYPAISRKDNKTKICPKCGAREAFEQFKKYKEKEEKKMKELNEKVQNIIEIEEVKYGEHIIVDADIENYMDDIEDNDEFSAITSELNKRGYETIYNVDKDKYFYIKKNNDEE